MPLRLTRHIGERIIIGDPASPLATVKVLDVNERQGVRLEIDAPKYIAINREELAVAKAKGSGK